MKLNITEEKENPLLKRKSVILNLDFEKGATASKADLQKRIAEHYKVEPKHVEIIKVLTKTGNFQGKAWANVWEEKEIPIYGEKKAEAVPEAK